LISEIEEREKIIQAMIDIITSNKIKFDLLGGTATAGILWAAYLADRLKKPMIYY